MKQLLAFLLTLMVAVPALANPPIDGNYKSTDVGGTMYTGLYSETWNGGPMAVNNTVNEASWDGANLGTQWTWSCAYVAVPPTLLYDGVNANGDGNKIWKVVYTSGTAWLSGTGPWADNEPAGYTATVDTWTATVTETYSNFDEVGTVKTVSATASFVGYPDVCIVLALSNQQKHGDGPTLPITPQYPAFIDNTCAGASGPGEWGEVDDITYSILNCTVSTKESTWGAIKARYRD